SARCNSVANYTLRIGPASLQPLATTEGCLSYEVANGRIAMKTIWDRIHTWLRQHAPDLEADLYPGASEEDLAEAERALGLTLPEDVKAAYRIHNGQHAPADGYPWAFLHGWGWLSLERVVGKWQEQREAMEAGGFAELCADPEGPVREDWWNLRW